MSLKEGEGWGWTRPPPLSRKTSGGGPSEATQKRKQLSHQQRLLKGNKFEQLIFCRFLFLFEEVTRMSTSFSNFLLHLVQMQFYVLRNLEICSDLLH